MQLLLPSLAVSALALALPAFAQQALAAPPMPPSEGISLPPPPTVPAIAQQAPATPPPSEVPSVPPPLAVPVVPQPKPPELLNWTVGAGFGWNWGALNPSGSMLMPGGMGRLPGGTLGSYSTRYGPDLAQDVEPAFGLFLERRLGAVDWLLLQVRFNHDTAVDDSTLERKLTVQSTSGDVELGIRHVFNPGGIVELSAFVIGGAGYSSHSRQDETSYQATPQSEPVISIFGQQSHIRSIGATAGLIFERTLLDQLALRFSAGLLGASYFTEDSAYGKQGEEPTKSKDHGADFGLRFQPGLELRFSF